jgi:hypothetical protein
MFTIINAAIIQEQQPSLTFRNPESIKIKPGPTISRADFDLIIPEQDELLEFKILHKLFSKTDISNITSLKYSGVYSFYSITITRASDKLFLLINIAISVNPDDAGLASVISPSSAAKDTSNKSSFTGKSIGKYAWSHPSSLIVADNWVLMKLQFMPKTIKNPDSSFTIPPISDGDKAWAEEMGRKILDRATVLGLTSRPAESAPLWAKEQVAKRRAEQKRQ